MNIIDMTASTCAIFELFFTVVAGIIIPILKQFIHKKFLKQLSLQKIEYCSKLRYTFAGLKLVLLGTWLPKLLRVKRD